MPITTYIGPIESEGEDAEIRIEAGSGDTAGMLEIGIYTYEDGDELVLMYVSRERVTELRDALSDWISG